MSKKVKKKKVQSPPSKTKKKTSKNPIWKKILYWGFFIIVAVLFLSDFSNNENYTNAFIKKDGQHVIWLQYLINLFLLGVVAFFGYSLVFSTKISKKWKYVLCLSAWVALFGLSMLAYKELISTNGDNAEYIVGAKSLVEEGGFYKLYSINNTPNDRLPPVIAIMLAPIYKTFGMDITKMKWVILLSYFFSIPLFYLIVRNYMEESWAIILSIVSFASPLLLHMSSMIMTELPFVFWSLLCIYVVILMAKEKAFTKKFYIFGILSAFLSLIVFLTRSIGFGMLPALVFFVFVLVNWKQLLKKDYSLFKSFEFKRFIAISTIVIAFGVIYLAYEKLFIGASKAGMASEKISFSENVGRNLGYTWKVWAQMIFPKNVAFWFIEPSKFTLKSIDVLWGTVTLASLVSILVAVYKKVYPAIAILFCYLIILIASNSTAEMVLARYILIFVPIAVFALIYSTIFFLKKFKQTVKIAMPIALGISALVLLSSFKGNALLIQKENLPKEVNIGFLNYIEMGEWCKQNLPQDAYISSRKPRLFYLFSDKKNLGITNYHEINDYVMNGKIDFDAFQEFKFQQWREKGVDYLILDGFNGSTAQNIYPIVNRNPNKFQVVHQIGEQAPSYLVKVNL